jgi:photosystem II stability/assembly factor-like uncharacterized protein
MNFGRVCREDLVMPKAQEAVVRLLVAGALFGLLLISSFAYAAHHAVSGPVGNRSDRLVAARSAGGAVSALPDSWMPQRPPPGLGGFRLQAVSCSTDGLHCLAAGVFCVSAPCAGKRAGAVLATADGGSVWVRRPLPPGIRFGGYLLASAARLSGALSCAGPLRCVVLAWQVRRKRSHMAILLTTSGGKKWIVVNGSRLGSGMFGVSCPTVSTCFAAGTDGSSGAVIKTTDGGRKWVRLRLPRGTGFLNSISCPSAARCTAVGSDRTYHTRAFAVSTANGGRAWSRGLMPRRIPGLTGVSCPTASRCFAVGSVYFQAFILVTTDGGKRWRESLDSNFNLLVAISCPSAGTCAAAGMDHKFTVTRLIAATSNGGSTWPAQTRPTGASELLGVSCSRTGRCVAVGNWWTYRGGQFTNSGAFIFTNHHL